MTLREQIADLEAICKGKNLQITKVSREIRDEDKDLQSRLHKAKGKTQKYKDLVENLEFEIKRLKTQKATMKEDLAQYDNRMMLPFDLKVENLTWDDKDNFESHLVDVA